MKSIFFLSVCTVYIILYTPVPSCTVAELIFTARYVWCCFWTLLPLFSALGDFAGKDLGLGFCSGEVGLGTGEARRAVHLKGVINVGLG